MSGKPKVVVTRNLPEVGQKLLEADGGVDIVQWKSDLPCDRQWLLDNAKGATGLLVMLNDKCDEEVLNAAGEGLKVIASFSVGTDHVTLPALKQRSIRLGYTPSALTDAVADIAVMLTLMSQRVGGEAMRAVIAGQWPQMPWSPLLLSGPQIKNATVGFLGFGRIAQATLYRLLPFGISKALYLSSKPGVPTSQDHFNLISESKIPIQPAQNLEQLAQEADILIVGCALSEDTKHLVNEEFLNKMKKRSVIVNIARGPVIDTQALTKALKEGGIWGAGLDVIENEPNIGADHPLVLEKRCVLLPHVGSANIETREQMAEETVRNLLAGLRGESMVNEKVL